MMVRAFSFLLGATFLTNCGGSKIDNQQVEQPVRYGPQNIANQNPKYRDYAPALSADGSKIVFLSYREASQSKAYKRDMGVSGAVTPFHAPGTETSRRALISSNGNWLASEERDNDTSITKVSNFDGSVQLEVKHPTDKTAQVEDTVISGDTNPLLVTVYKTSASSREAWASGVDAQGQVVTPTKFSAFDVAETNLSFVGDRLVSTTVSNGTNTFLTRATGGSAATLAAAASNKVSIDPARSVLAGRLTGSVNQAFVTLDVSKENYKVIRENDQPDTPDDQRPFNYAFERVFPVNLDTGALGEMIPTSFMTRVKGHANAAGDLVLVEGLDTFNCSGIDVNSQQRGPNLAIYDVASKRLTRVLLRQADPVVSQYEVTSKPCGFKVEGKTDAIYNRNFSEVTLATGSTKDKITMAFTLLDTTAVGKTDYEVYWLQFGLDANGELVNPVLKNVSENHVP